MWLNSHIFKKQTVTLNEKKAQEEKEKHSEGKQTLKVWRLLMVTLNSTAKKDGTDWADGLFTTVKQYTSIKKKKKLQKSSQSKIVQVEHSGV